jgi:hypothetical protein
VLSFLLRDEFLTRERVRLWSLGMLLTAVAVVVFFLATAHGLNDLKGRPLGTDFSDVYAAGQLARDGAPAHVYDPAVHHRQEQAIFGHDTPFYGWHYPPFFLVLASALSALPYLVALGLWQLLTFAAYFLAMRALQRNGPSPQAVGDPVWLLVVVGFPAVLVNLLHGQNGFLTTALLAGGLALLDRRPLAAGILLGLMAYKPQFGVLIPLALAAGGKWRTFGAATATVLGLIALATLAFGVEIWPAFLASGHFSRTVVLEAGGTGFEKIQSVFSAVRFIGGPVGLAYGAQALAAVAVAAVVIHLWRNSANAAVKGAALCLGTLLVTPYSLDYDLMLLAPAIALLAGDGRARGFRKGELLLLGGLWILPAGARALASGTHIVIAPVLIAAALVFAWRRADSRFERF